MKFTHYEVLGLKIGATSAEIKSAYRKIVLKHHPDRTSDPQSKAIFLQATDAYKVLTDPEAKLRYDEHLELILKRAQEEGVQKAREERRQAQEAKLKEERKATPSGETVAEEVMRLQGLYGKGRYLEAEKLAHRLMQINPRLAIPYAVMADILRGQGRINEASTMYAYAAQMDPANPVYQRRYEQLLRGSKFVTDRNQTRLEARDNQLIAPLVGGSCVLLGGVYIAFSTETAMSSRLPLVSTWTLGLCLSLFVSGVAIGASLAVGNLLDRIDSTVEGSSGRSGPTVVLGMVAIVNFWVSAILYVLAALGLRGFNVSTTRMMTGVGLTTMLYSFAAIPSHINQLQIFEWGGNLVYIGGLVGWMVADALRPG